MTTLCAVGAEYNCRISIGRITMRVETLFVALTTPHMRMGTGRRHHSGRPQALRVVLTMLVVALTGYLLFGRSGKAEDERRCDLASYDSSAAALDLKKCGLTALPASIMRFTQLKKLDLGFNSLTDLPRLPDSIETLFCLGNDFETIPESVARLPTLRVRAGVRSSNIMGERSPLPSLSHGRRRTARNRGHLSADAVFLPSPLW